MVNRSIFVASKLEYQTRYDQTNSKILGTTKMSTKNNTTFKVVVIT